jgi:hypothetical protein
MSDIEMKTPAGKPSNWWARERAPWKRISDEIAALQAETRIQNLVAHAILSERADINRNMLACANAGATLAGLSPHEKRA